MDEKTFDRVEKKYLLTKSQYDTILPLVKSHTTSDEYYLSDIYNIYYDTANYDLIVQSIDQPDFKEKLRARSYDGYDKVFLEIKTKLRGHAALAEIEEPDNNLGFKRRVLITHDDYDKFKTRQSSAVELARRDEEQGTDIQIAKEIDYLVSHLDLKPRIFVRYHRESYKGERDLRVTFDTDLQYRTCDLSFRKHNKDRPAFIGEPNIIMEVKAHGSVPLWFARALSQNHIYPQQFSKIGSIYNKIRKEKNV